MMKFMKHFKIRKKEYVVVEKEKLDKLEYELQWRINVCTTYLDMSNSNSYYVGSANKLMQECRTLIDTVKEF